MRKRLVIGAIAAVVIGVAAYILSMPMEGTVEWHKQEYVRIVKQLQRKTVRDWPSILWARATGRRLAPLTLKEELELRKQLENHRPQLLKAGYFIERRFQTTNHDARVLDSGMARHWAEHSLPVERRYYTWMVGARGSDTLVVFGRPQDMEFWEKAIREAELADFK